MLKSQFQIAKMDCPSEESLIRMKLGAFSGIRHLDFDLEQRRLNIYHDGDAMAISAALDDLKLGSKLIDSQASNAVFSADSSDQSAVLKKVLVINLAFFLIEITAGYIAQSFGLIADSLDMLADALVYGLSLWAVGAAISRKKQVANWAGYLQIILALIGFVAVIERFFVTGTNPDFKSMIIISALALIANAWCLLLLRNTQHNKEVHFQASMIFTSNDLLVNLGVIAAGILVFIFESPLPDLIIGTLVFLLVLRGAQRILALAKA